MDAPKIIDSSVSARSLYVLNGLPQVDPLSLGVSFAFFVGSGTATSRGLAPGPH